MGRLALIFFQVQDASCVISTQKVYKQSIHRKTMTTVYMGVKIIYIKR